MHTARAWPDLADAYRILAYTGLTELYTGHLSATVLIHDDRQGTTLAEGFGESGAMLLRKHGAGAVGSSVKATTTQILSSSGRPDLAFIAEQFGGPAPEYNGFGNDLLEVSGEGLLEEGFDSLRRRFRKPSSPPTLGGH